MSMVTIATWCPLLRLRDVIGAVEHRAVSRARSFAYHHPSTHYVLAFRSDAHLGRTCHVADTVLLKSAAKNATTETKQKWKISQFLSVCLSRSIIPVALRLFLLRANFCFLSISTFGISVWQCGDTGSSCSAPIAKPPKCRHPFRNPSSAAIATTNTILFPHEYNHEASSFFPPLALVLGHRSPLLRCYA